jgi:hypothetical protein
VVGAFFFLRSDPWLNYDLFAKLARDDNFWKLVHYQSVNWAVGNFEVILRGLLFISSWLK